MTTEYQPVTDNSLIDAVLAQSGEDPVVRREPDITPPPDLEFDLPGGYMTPAGDSSQTAEVRELTGRDEELISRATSVSKTIDVVLSRGLVSVGGQPPTDDMRDGLLAGDRDYILIRIYAATFGRGLDIPRYCSTCADEVTVHVDLIDDVPTKTLASPADRYFPVDCSVGQVSVGLPTGRTQRVLMEAADKATMAELSTTLLEHCVLDVPRVEFVNRAAVLDLPLRDRRAISEAIAERSPGPQMQDIVVPCPNCDSPLEVPLAVAALFQF